MSDFWISFPSVYQGLTLVQRRIEDIVSASRGFIRPYLQDMMGTQGKMLRPACVLLSAQMGEKQDQEDLITNLAAGIELIHAASLVHDDIIDEAPMRRGAAALHKRIGNRRAVVAGDYLMAKAFSLFSQASLERINSRTVSDRIGRLCESEIDQDGEIGDFTISRTHYLRRIGGKTAALFSLSCYLGAAAGGVKPLQVRRLSRFGYNLGMAFQIQDDILDYQGDHQSMGKKTGRDLSAGIATLPFLCARDKDRSGKLLKLVSDIPHDESSVDEAVSMVSSLGGVQCASEIAEAYQRRSLHELALLPDVPAREILGELLHRLTDRSS